MDKRERVEFIESYIKGVNGSADYQWHDNHGELIRCKDCKHYNHEKKWCQHIMSANGDDWFCADGERRNNAGS